MTDPESRGVVIIEWPASAPLGVGALPGWKVSVFDAFSGDSPEPREIRTVTGVEVRASPHEIITASLTMLADADGNPLFDGEPVVKDGEILTGTFPFIVAEMRVRQ